MHASVTLDTELAQVVQDDLDLIGGLLANDRGLQIALVDADDQGHADVVGEHSLRQGDVDLLLIGLGLSEIFPTS